MRLRPWRNWHTRTFEGRVQQWVRVQVPSAAPKPSEFCSEGFLCALFLPEHQIFLHSHDFPRPSVFPLLRFLRRVVKLRKSGVPMPRTPQVDAERCTHCGYCVKHCPAGAIIKGDECNTVAEKCIKCCACVKGCPQKARTYDMPFAVLLSDCFKKQKEDRIIL